MLRFVAKLLPATLLVATLAAAQSTPPRKSIPAIAKAANGAVVSIVMSDKDGNPIAQGSGFFVSKDGLVVTNYHVIAEGVSAVVKLPDGAFYLVDGVLAFDKVRDIAVIKAHGENFHMLTLADSDRVQVGQEVVAIGNPLSLESTVSNGIVSSIRSLNDNGEKYLQITAPISPGSSGGPLFNMEGQVVGITTMYIKGGENLNFAIPINNAKSLLKTNAAKLQNFPNQAEPVDTQTQDRGEDASPPGSKSTQTTNAPTLKTAVAFMQRMVEPEHREVVLAEVKNSKPPPDVLHPLQPIGPGPVITIVSSHPVAMVLPTGENQDAIISEGGDGKRYPRFILFALGDIDPSSIRSVEGGYDLDTVSKFWVKHPGCEADPQCERQYLNFLESLPRLTTVAFHTTDLKPLIEQGGFEPQENCPQCDLKPVIDGTTSKTGFFFRDKDRAERFVTALIYAVKSAGGKPDLFPPTP